MPSVRFSDGNGWLTARSAVWSAEGVFLATAQIFPPGTVLSVAVTAPGDRRPTILSARVTSASISGTSGMNAVLAGLDEASRRVVSRLCADAEPRRSARVRAR